MSRHPVIPEQLIARCRRAAAALTSSTNPAKRAPLAQELADLLAQLAAVSAQSDIETRTWLKTEAAAVRASVLTAEVRRTAPAWAALLLLPQGLLPEMDGNEYDD